MSLPDPFLLERHFAKHEFTAPYLLSCSDCDGWPLSELMSWADDETRRLWDGLALGYSDSRGLPLLRAEIAALYRGISPEQVLCAVPEEAILLAMESLLEPGDHVVCTYPGYQSLYELARARRCLVSLWKPEEGRGWAFELSRLESLLRPTTRLVVMNFPHNPTGSLPSEDEYRLMVRAAEKSGAFLFSDEMYRGLEHAPGLRLPSACELTERAVSLSGMSKVYGLAGLRQGWLVARDAALYERLCRMKDYTTICGAAPSELLALIGLRARDRIVKAHLERIARNLDTLDAFFQKRPVDFSWIRPRAGTVGLARLERGGPASEFCEELVRKKGVMLLPSSVFDWGNEHVRLGFGRRHMNEALTRLEEFLESAPR